ncbi:MAG: gamma carbonic anhydrase family protein [Lachnospiraceae bacterium]|nr:gamma carbonic anhydrase family protein [Lachnospiraceae bacterium]
MENPTKIKLPVPTIAPSAFIAKGAVVMGNVTLEADTSIWYNAVVRSIDKSIHIGEGSNIQDNAVVHVDEDHGVSIGKHVTVGHSAIIHGCRIDDNTLIGMGAIILNGATIGKNCIIGAGALVTQDTIIPDNSLVIGRPGKIIRQVSDENVAGSLQNALHYIDEAALYKRMEEET